MSQHRSSARAAFITALDLARISGRAAYPTTLGRRTASLRSRGYASPR
jgi:hypothetical protein